MAKAGKVNQLISIPAPVRVTNGKPLSGITGPDPKNMSRQPQFWFKPGPSTISEGGYSMISASRCEVAPAVDRSLPDGQVQIWAIDLATKSYDRAAATVLSAGERDRAERYVFERDHAAYTSGRVALRRILSGYLGISPAMVPIVHGPAGKPELGGRCRTSGIQFNLSGSGDLALLAVTRCRTLGVDVEQVRAVHDLAGLADIVLSTTERTAFAATPACHRLDFFYRAWTLKEAYLKARGEGLARSPALIDCGTVSDDGRQTIRDADDSRSIASWAVSSWRPSAHYHAALVAEAPVHTIIFASLARTRLE